jgi:hypothetical protein
MKVSNVGGATSDAPHPWGSTSMTRLKDASRRKYLDALGVGCTDA